MSSTNRGAGRLANDAYFTPVSLAVTLTWTLDIPTPKLVLEPHMGQGAFLQAAALRWPGADLWANDITPITRIHLHACTQEDFLRFTRVHPLTWVPDLIIGNPPYARPEEDEHGEPTGRVNDKGKLVIEPCAELHVRKALELVRPGGHVAFLLRLAFLETAERYPLWQELPVKKVTVLAERVAFSGMKGTDSAAYGWFLWEKGWSGKTELEVLSWKNKRR